MPAVAPAPGGQPPSISSDALRSLYADWEIERAQAAGPTNRRSRNLGFIATCPANEASQSETSIAVSN